MRPRFDDAMFQAQCPPLSEPDMPSLIRLLVILGLIGGAVYGVLWSFANLVEPHPREMSVSVPQDRFAK
jgi:hypothetical protein